MALTRFRRGEATAQLMPLIYTQLALKSDQGLSSASHRDTRAGADNFARAILNDSSNHGGSPLAKLSGLLVLAIAMCLAAGSITTSAQPSPTATGNSMSATPSTPSWPRVFDRNGTHVVVYQPQLKAWQRYRELFADTAISVTDKGQKPVVGVISWHAQTITDQSAQTVYISNIVVMDARFPSLDAAQTAAMQKRVHQIYPTMTLTIGLPRMIASLEDLNQPVRSVAAGTKAPTILVSTVPAIVLFVDGKPVLAPIQGTNLQYVVNTNFDLFYDNSDYYLLVAGLGSRQRNRADRGPSRSSSHQTWPSYPQSRTGTTS